MKRFFIVGIFFIVSIISCQSLVRIEQSDLEFMKSLYSFDIAYVRGKAYVEIVADKYDIDILNYWVIPYQRIIEDLPEYYSARLEPEDMGGYKTYSEIVTAFDSMQALFLDIISKKATIQIFDLNGRKLETFNTNAYQNEIVWNADDLTSGIYFIKAFSGNREKVRRILLIK